MLTLNGHTFIPTMFPDRTSQVWNLGHIITGMSENKVVWHFEREAELIHLQQLKLLLDAIDNFIDKPYPAELSIPYLPYARQDKEVRDDRTFALEAFAQIINSQKWDKVSAFDVHNPRAAFKLIDRFHNVQPDLWFLTKYDTVIFPDFGAMTRYGRVMIQQGIADTLVDKIFSCNKNRDPQTGRIENFAVNGDPDLKGKKIIVVDDLCDGGATFNILADTALEKTLSSTLYVSHGLFSRGIGQLLKNYDQIITTDTCFSDVLSEPNGWTTAAKQSPKWAEMSKAVDNNRLVFKPRKAA